MRCGPMRLRHHVASHSSLPSGVRRPADSGRLRPFVSSRTRPASWSWPSLNTTARDPDRSPTTALAKWPAVGVRGRTSSITSRPVTLSTLPTVTSVATASLVASRSLVWLGPVP